MPAGGPAGLVPGPAIKTLQDLEAQAQGSPATASFRGPSATRTGGFLSTGSLLVFPQGSQALGQEASL